MPTGRDDAYREAEEKIEQARRSGAKELDLRGMGLTGVPEALGTLTALQELWLHGNQLTSVPEALGKLTALQGLSLSNNQLTSVPEALGKLAQLQRLFLRNNHLVELPESLGQLSQMYCLDLHGNRLIALPESLGQLTHLGQLFLSGNQLTTLPESLGSNTQLLELSLSDNRLTSLPESLGQLLRLWLIHLDCNQLTTLPEALRTLCSEGRLERLFLHGNPALGLPAEVLGPTWGEVGKGNPAAKPAAILDYYFSRREQGARPLNEVKLMLVGRGGAGKTSIVERLVRGSFDEEQESTTGIALQDWPLPCPGGGPVTVHVWDFAGQVIAHATHQFFLSARSVYVLVLTAREDSQRDDAEYWLRLIRAFGSEEGNTPEERKISQVLVALNKWDTDPVRLDREALREKYPFIAGFVETDCESGRGIAELKAKLAEMIGNDKDVREKAGAAYFNVKEALRKRWHDEKTNYLDYPAFEAVCAAQGVTESDRQRAMALNLHRLGLALNYGDDPRLRDTTVLNPHWVTDGIYLLLRKAPNTRAELTLQSACNTLPKEEQKRVMFLIRLMQKYDLAFPLREDEETWLVPQALADSQPALGPEWHGEATRLRWTYVALPEGLLPRFITRTHTLSEGQSRWLNGTILALGGARALVRADATDRRITATVIGSDPARQQLAGTIQAEMRGLNKEIRGLDPLEELQMQRNPEVWLPVAGLEEAEKEKQPELKIPTPKGTVKVNATDENNRLTNEDARTDVWKPRVFISYSHKDDAAKDALVLKLKVLQTAGLVDFWVDRDLAAGEEWNTGVKVELEKMDVFVLLVSDHSLTSAYINRVEIKRALERKVAGTAEVVPVILQRCQWKACGVLDHLVALPKDGKPVKDHRPHSLGWHDVSERLLDLFKKLKKQHAGEHRAVEDGQGIR